MKKFGTLMLGSIAFLAVSCSGSAEEVTQEQEEAVVEPITYTIDKEASSLGWYGDEGPEHFHTGTVMFSEGTLTMKGDAVESGSFTVDMKSIAVNDETPEDKVGYLIGHLGNEDFFNVEAFPATKVTLGEYADGQLDITLEVLGQSVESTVPVTIATSEDGAKMTGEFSIDFASLNLPGFQPNEEHPEETVSSVIKFNLDAALTK